MQEATMPLDAAPGSLEGVQLTLQEKREIFTWALRQRSNQRFKTLVGVELMSEPTLREVSTVGTALEAGIQALRDRGVVIVSHVGAVMDVLEIDRRGLHYAVCYCRYGDEVSGSHAATGFGQAFGWGSAC